MDEILCGDLSAGVDNYTVVNNEHGFILFFQSGNVEPYVFADKHFIADLDLVCSRPVQTTGVVDRNLTTNRRERVSQAYPNAMELD